jgi:hypothetical protein
MWNLTQEIGPQIPCFGSVLQRLAVWPEGSVGAAMFMTVCILPAVL